MRTVERVPVPVATRAEYGTTNAYVVGRDGGVLVDPAARDGDLDAVVARRDPDHVVVTHAHPDHVGAVADYAAGRTVWAPAGFADRFERATGVVPDRTFREGTTVDLDAPTEDADAPTGDADRPTEGADRPTEGADRPTGDAGGAVSGAGGPAVEVLETPGHAPDHVAFAVGDAVLAGDLVVAGGSVVVGAGEGDVRAYLASLRRLYARDPGVLYPGHGPVVEAPRAEIARLLGHRRERERRIREAVRGGARTPAAIVDAAYDEDLAGVRDLARSTVVAHLRKLAVEGAVEWDGERARPA